MTSIIISGNRLEYRMIDGAENLATIVFLHEGLGSVELWRDFPDMVAAKTGHPALVYSRIGHGWSDPLPAPRQPGFMHQEALVTLPALLDELDVHQPILVGHSDGASIALIRAGAGDRDVSAVVALAPHVFVEAQSIAGADASHRAFRDTDMAQKMAKYHRDPARTFFGWYDIWRSPEFGDWNIEGVLAGIDCPLLVVQGADDEYGSVAQIEAIEARVPGKVERVWLSDCGHSPHLDRPETVVAATVDFIRRHDLQRAPSRHSPFSSD
ncbi:MAG: alpha/beta fold hydrolase [Acidimicrobiia bacterium]